MSYEVKFGFEPGNNLVFTAFQPNGTGRGLAHQFMLEVFNHGYYRATPITTLVVGDAVIVYKQEKVYYADELVVVLAYENVFYENEYVWHGTEYVYDYDTESNHTVFWTEKPVGVGEYESAIDISSDIGDLVDDQTAVYNVYDERDGVAGVGVGAGVESEIVTDC